MKVYTPSENYKLNKMTMTAKLYNKQFEHEKVDFDPKISKEFK